LTSTEARPKSRLAAEKAIQLDDHSAEAHTSLANYKFFYGHDWEGCEREFRRAIALNPNYAFAHDQFGLALALLGRIDEAIVEGRRAAELDPLSPQIPLDDAVAFMFRGDFTAARELARKSAELDPAFFFAPYVDGWIDIESGHPAQALASLQKAKALGSPEFVSAWLAYAYGVSGDRTHALAELEAMKKKSRRGEPLPFNEALVYLGLGDRPRAIHDLERANAADSQFIPWIKMDRIFDSLRREPRFVALMKTSKLDR
jgi:tetratricopeptide (TPR) repeat protein